MRPKELLSSKFFVPVFTLTFGFILIVLAVTRVVQTESFIKRAERTTGTVMESRHGMLVWSAVVTVSYYDTEGVARQAKFETGEETTSIKKDDKINLLYDSADKSYVYSGNPRLRRYPVTGIYFILGGCLILFTFRRFREGGTGTEISV